MAKTVPTIITRTEPITKEPLCTSLFTYWSYLVARTAPIISALIFSCGKATVGTSHSKKSHNVFHPFFEVIHQQIVSGNNGLYSVVVDTISLSENTGGLVIRRGRSNGGIKKGIYKSSSLRWEITTWQPWTF